MQIGPQCRNIYNKAVRSLRAGNYFMFPKLKSEELIPPYTL